MRVRATEIETFDRASVIIPNSEFITGVVKNWTRANRLGRIVVKVGVSYETDPDRVRDILTRHSQCLPADRSDPPPAAYLWPSGKRRSNSSRAASARSRKACRSGANSTTPSSRSSAKPHRKVRAEDR